MDIIPIVQLFSDAMMPGFELSLMSPINVGVNVGLLHGSHVDWIILAQQFDVDPFAGIRGWFGNLVATGQLWALIIGFILGYLFRGFTSYG